MSKPDSPQSDIKDQDVGSVHSGNSTSDVQKIHEIVVVPSPEAMATNSQEALKEMVEYIKSKIVEYEKETSIIPENNILKVD
ncbi:hypothetical protein Ddc_02278 [Ditylenchus destructor]|nr:hypothetical protein Ddc_02278 [Ditylenchus destructor]